MGTNNFISKVTPLGSSTTYTIKDPIAQELIIGTQTSTTNLWTGKSTTIYALYNGLTIKYFLPRSCNGSNVTLNLTLADNTTTGAIPCYYESQVYLSDQFKVGSVIQLTYFGANSASIDGTTISTARWIAQQSNHSYEQRTYRSSTNIELPIAAINGTESSTATVPTITTNSYRDVFAAIPETAANVATMNPSTGKMTVPGGVNSTYLQMSGTAMWQYNSTTDAVDLIFN